MNKVTIDFLTTNCHSLSGYMTKLIIYAIQRSMKAIFQSFFSEKRIFLLHKKNLNFVDFLYKKIIVLSIIFLNFLTYDLAYGWTITKNYEDLLLGSKAGMSGVTISDIRANSGTKSARVEFPAGSDCWGICGDTLSFPEPVYEGGEIWARGYFYFASPWSWSSSPVAKVFRIHVATGSGSNAGYLSALLEPEGRIAASNEVQSYQPTTATYYTVDGWQSIELYAKLSSIAGQGIFRIWKNGILVFEDKTRRTLSSPTDKVDYNYIFTYWNGGVPQKQYAWIDDFIVTTDRPLNRDANGNYMIGLVSTSELTAPTGLTIK
ncbi:MAG TPA: hypothetical protein PKY50_11240 [Candidatus Competibacter sp.]|nr:hypothetical protein [Candidatus Competibacter sp.]